MTDAGAELQRVLAEAIGTRIRVLRLARGMTQRELARLIWTHRPIIGRIERGLHTPDLFTVRELARALGMSLRGFVAGIDFQPIDEAARQTLRRSP